MGQVKLEVTSLVMELANVQIAFAISAFIVAIIVGPMKI